MGADTEVGDVSADCTKLAVKCIICLEATGGSGGPGVSRKTFKGHEEFAPALGIDGAGIKPCPVSNSNCYDMTG